MFISKNKLMNDLIKIEESSKNINKHKALINFTEKFISAQEPLEPEFNKIFQNNFWDLLT